MGWSRMPQGGSAIGARRTGRSAPLGTVLLLMGLASGPLVHGQSAPAAGATDGSAKVADHAAPRPEQSRSTGSESPRDAIATTVSGATPTGRATDDPAAPILHEEALLDAGRERVEPWFGRSVAVAGTAVIAASPRDGDGGTAQGTAHVFSDSKRGWRRVQRLQSSDPTWEDRFAQALAADKGRLVVGRDRADEGTTDAGAVTVFRRSGYHFKREAEITPPDPGSGDGFGGAVAISGNVIVVGAARDDDGGLDAGTATVWEWSDEGWTLQARLASSDPASGDWFGCAVAVDGLNAAIGAYGDDDRGEKSGTAHLYRREGGAWTLDATFAPEDLAAGDWFGFSVALSGDTLAVGAPRDDLAGESAGSVRIFRRQRDGWRLEETLRPPAGSITTWFGYAVALEGPKLLVGVPGDDRGGESAGAAALFERIQGRWVLRAELLPSSPQTDEQFGSAVALRGDFAAVGRLATEDGEVTSGRAWVFRLGGTSKRVQESVAPAGGGSVPDKPRSDPHATPLAPVPASEGR